MEIKHILDLKCVLENFQKKLTENSLEKSIYTPTSFLTEPVC